MARIWKEQCPAPSNRRPPLATGEAPPERSSAPSLIPVWTYFVRVCHTPGRSKSIRELNMQPSLTSLGLRYTGIGEQAEAQLRQRFGWAC
jgi:hypothetical protein